MVSSPQVRPTDILQRYIQEISRYPVLSKEDELKWFKSYREKNDRQALKILIQSNLRFVVKIAMEYNRFGSRLIDLIQEGNMGLLKAINEFNPYKGVRLITYAVWWIRGAIQEYLMRQHSIVRIGKTPQQKKLFYLLRKERLNPHGEPVSIPLLSSQTGISQKEIETMRQRLAQKDMSLDYNTSATMDQNLIDVQNSPSASPDETIQHEQEVSRLRQVIKKLRPLLSPKEIHILENRILKDPPVTLQEIGSHFSVTRESIRQVESKLLEKIKKEMLKVYSSKSVQKEKP